MIPLGMLGAAAQTAVAPVANWPLNEGTGSLAYDVVANDMATLGFYSRWTPIDTGMGVTTDPNVAFTAQGSWPIHLWDGISIKWRMRLNSGIGDTMVIAQDQYSDIIGVHITESNVKAWAYFNGEPDAYGNIDQTATVTYGVFYDWVLRIHPATGIRLYQNGVLLAAYWNPGGLTYIGKLYAPSTYIYLSGAPWAYAPSTTIDYFEIYDSEWGA